MAKGVTLGINLPPQMAIEIRRLVYEYLYSKGEKDGIVYNTILNNKHLTIEQLRWKLDKEHGIFRSNAGLKKIASMCGLPYDRYL